MQKLIILFTTILFAWLPYQEDNFTYTIKGNENSTHYIRPFVLDVKNNDDKTQTFKVDVGTVLIPGEAGMQHFIVTEPIVVELKPRQTKHIDVHAMCIMQYNNAPAGGEGYKVGKLVDNKDMLALAHFISENNLHNYQAQNMMWDLVEGFYNDFDIDRFEITDNGNLAAYSETQKVLTPDYDNYEPIEYPTLKKYNGEFTMNFAFPMDVHIAIFNQQNVVRKEIYKNPKTPAGLTKIPYAFTSEELEEGIYTIKLIANGDILLNREVEI